MKGFFIDRADKHCKQQHPTKMCAKYLWDFVDGRVGLLEPSAFQHRCYRKAVSDE